MLNYLKENHICHINSNSSRFNLKLKVKLYKGGSSPCIGEDSLQKSIKPLYNCTKEGFTIIELISVMAIIAVLAVVSFPKMSSYIDRAKETKILATAREVMMAAESYNYSGYESIDDSDTYLQFKDKLIDADYININVNDDIIDSDISLEQLRKIVETGSNYDINEGKLFFEEVEDNGGGVTE